MTWPPPTPDPQKSVVSSICNPWCSQDTLYFQPGLKDPASPSATWRAAKWSKDRQTVALSQWSYHLLLYGLWIRMVFMLFNGWKNQRKDSILACEKYVRTFLVVQWLKLCTPKAGVLGSTDGQGTRSHMPQLKEPTCCTLRPGAAK